MVERSLLGLHHVAAIAGDAQENLDFYAGVLGLRLVKKSVIVGSPSTYFLCYGDDLGRPGTQLTFVPFPQGSHGRPGTGQATLVTLSIPRSSLNFWQDRLKDQRLGNVRDGFDFEAPDGLRLRLSATDEEAVASVWRSPTVKPENAILGLESVTLEVEEIGPTEDVLINVLGLHHAGTHADIQLYALDSEPIVQLRHRPGGVVQRGGRGVVRQVAFRVGDMESLQNWRNLLLEKDLKVSPIRDHHYYHAVYFREPGGVMLELSTEGPGFTLDETYEELGTHLCLTERYEPFREQIERTLPPLK